MSAYCPEGCPDADACVVGKPCQLHPSEDTMKPDSEHMPLPDDEPVTDEPVTDEPVTDEPVTDEPVTDAEPTAEFVQPIIQTEFKGKPSGFSITVTASIMGHVAVYTIPNEVVTDTNPLTAERVAACRNLAIERAATALGLMVH